MYHLDGGALIFFFWFHIWIHFSVNDLVLLFRILAKGSRWSGLAKDWNLEWLRLVGLALFCHYYLPLRILSSPHLSGIRRLY